MEEEAVEVMVEEAEVEGEAMAVEAVEVMGGEADTEAARAAGEVSNAIEVRSL